jgi:hypothetical protein
MSDLTVGIRHLDGTFTSSRMPSSVARFSFQSPSFLEGDTWDLYKRMRSYLHFNAPAEDGYVLVDEKTKTISQWAVVPGIELVYAADLGIDVHWGVRNRTPLVDMLLKPVDEKLRGADFNGVSPSSIRKALLPYITGALYFRDLVDDQIVVEFSPFSSEVELIKKVKELAWDGVRRDWLVQGIPHFVDCRLSMPGWKLERITNEDLPAFKKLIETMVELTDADLEAWEDVAIRNWIDLDQPVPGFG